MTSERDLPRDRGGLAYVDLSPVADIEVARALQGLLGPQRMHRRWRNLRPEAKRLHQDILRAYLENGAPPRAQALDAALLDDLIARDLVVGGPEGIAATYPFSTKETRHRVNVGGRENFAVCAIDALGVGAMAGQASQVGSICPVCEKRVLVDIGAGGLKVQWADPPEACVWAGAVPVGACAATSQCQVILMFCSPEHRMKWRNGDASPREGFELGVSQAVQAGAAIFRPFLAGFTRGSQQ